MMTSDANHKPEKAIFGNGLFPEAFIGFMEEVPLHKAQFRTPNELAFRELPAARCIYTTAGVSAAGGSSTETA